MAKKEIRHPPYVHNVHYRVNVATGRYADTVDLPTEGVIVMSDGTVKAFRATFPKGLPPKITTVEETEE